MNWEEIKALIDKQGEAFDAFKKTHDELKNADVVTAEKLGRIEQSLDQAVEAKASLEQLIEAEKKEREGLEARINKLGIQANSDEDAKQRVALAELNITLGAAMKSRNKNYNEMDMEGYNAYRDAQLKFLREGEKSLTEAELKTLSVGSDPDGGYFVTPDTSGRVVRKIFETSPMRSICGQQTISTDKLEGVEDRDEAGAGYAGESTQGSDTTTPQVGKWEIPVFWIDTEPKATQQLLDDAAVDIEGWLAGKVADKIGRFENSEFVTGSAGKIRGLTSYDTALDDGSGVSWGSFGHIITGVNGNFAASNKADKLFDVIGLLKEAYLMNARWLTRRAVITEMRKFKDGNGQYLWQPSLQAGMPEVFAGYPITRAEDMPALATGSLSLAFGDFSQAYQIVDRQGIRVMRDPYTSKPFVKFYTTKRTGGGALDFEAVKFLKFTA
jgi:HK97 family phage major capsid protein